MSRKSFALAVAIALLLVGGSTSALFLLIRHEPEVYRRAAVPPGQERKRLNDEFKLELSLLLNSLQPGAEQPFDVRLTDEQINSYFAEGFKQQGLEERLLPEGLSEPRIVFEPGQIHLAFRYGSGLWSSVITV